MFDGIGALRVACDVLQLPMAGQISIENNPEARRVVEAFFPDSLFHEDVRTVDEELVRKFALRFSNVGIILIGAGPPCQGVSGLNFDKRGALNDHRSSLFAEVPRVTELFRVCFPWAQVHRLMESVASMSEEDCAVMSQSVGLSLPGGFLRAYSLSASTVVVDYLGALGNGGCQGLSGYIVYLGVPWVL